MVRIPRVKLRTGEDWDSNLNLNKKAIKKSQDFSPALFLRKGEETTIIAICGTKSGEALKRVIKNILKEESPDYYIFAFVGWSTDFAEKVFGEYPEYEHIVDMPLDDRTHTYIQLMVNREYGLIKSYMAGIDSKGNLVNAEDGGLESKFVLSWKG